MRLLLTAVILVSIAAPSAYAQTTPQSKFGIIDNSFFVEEAFNQEPRTFQNMFVVSRGRHGRWDGSFTQEWPIGSMRHQASFGIPFSFADGNGAIGDVEVNYRYQVWEESAGRPALAPRLTLMVPTSVESHEVAWEVNVPFSKRAGAFYFHVNGGATFDDRNTPYAAASVIAAVSPMFNLMLEGYVESTSGDGGRAKTWILSPGFRTGWNLGEKQIVIGIGVPVTRGADRDIAVLSYFSYELPFKK